MCRIALKSRKLQNCYQVIAPLQACRYVSSTFQTCDTQSLLCNKVSPEPRFWEFCSNASTSVTWWLSRWGALWSIFKDHIILNCITTSTTSITASSGSTTCKINVRGPDCRDIEILRNNIFQIQIISVELSLVDIMIKKKSTCIIV